MHPCASYEIDGLQHHRTLVIDLACECGVGDGLSYLRGLHHGHEHPGGG